MSAQFPPQPPAGWPAKPPVKKAGPTPPRVPERLVARLVRGLRDLALMAVVGPLVGVATIGAIHLSTSMHDAETARIEQDRRESERALAALEDRPVHGVAPALPPVAVPPPPPPVADFGAVQPTDPARHMADWVVGRRDNGGLPFVVLDKADARLYVFQPGGQLVADTPVLLGSSHGDDTYPGIGDVPIADVKPYQRTTAAGRFVTQPGLDADHTDVVWLDYDAALAMHRVINKVKSERRLQRLASPTPDDRRISWGCINIPVEFFDGYISPVFGKRRGVAYVIPETKTFAEVFEPGGVAAAPVTASAAPGASMAPRDVAER